MHDHHSNERPARGGGEVSHCARFSRRDVLKAGAGAAAAGYLPLGAASLLHAAPIKRPQIAVVFTIFTFRSHGHVLLENFLEPYYFNGKMTDPGVDIVAFYGDQFPDGDMARDASKTYDIPIYDTIDAALCRGGRELAVDAVLIIGEHGDYPMTELGQRMYPRKRFFDETVAVMRRSGRYVPMFNDKHLSYRWDWAKEMYDTARELGIPFMAGSSVPLAERRPPFELPAESKITEAVSIHGGPVESYDYHGIEVLQSIVEARAGGEVGVSEVEFLEGDALWKAADAGRWSPELARAAMAAELGHEPESLRGVPGEGDAETHGILLTYRDGWKGIVLGIGSSSIRWNFACRTAGDDRQHATSFYVGPWQNRNLFKALAHAIQYHFTHGKAPYPVERTLLSTGVLEAAMRSRHEGKALATPHLEFAYAPRDYRAMREMGATWKLINDKTIEVEGICPNGLQP